MDQFEAYRNIPKEKFALANENQRLHDVKLETKPVGYFKDAFRRFAKNKASLVAAVIIGILLLFAIIGPFFGNEAYTSAYLTDTALVRYKFLKPRVPFLAETGFWDGGMDVEIPEALYIRYRAREQEMNCKIIIRDDENPTVITNADGKTSKLYRVRLDSYRELDPFLKTVTADEYAKIQQYQNETGNQVILPRSNSAAYNFMKNSFVDIWFESDKQGNARLDENGNFVPAYATTGKDDYSSTRVEGDPGIEDPTASDRYRYAMRTGASGTYNYEVRIDAYQYFVYRFGFEPSFLFGTDARGFDIFSRLASGARFSFLLALVVSVINLTIGAIYGAIEGYYGGAVDMVMERISDVLSGVPFTVVAVLFNLHLAGKIGIVPSLLFAFVMTGWIGMASSVRMQFYRFKNQEYVLAARTLGANDFRVMFKHIFPNSLGTIITGSVLVIPGVIFSETSLSYLGIINLDSASMSSVGSMLSAGQECMVSNPHVVLFPAIFIALLEISFNLFGNGLRDAFNPSLRGSEG